MFPLLPFGRKFSTILVGIIISAIGFSQDLPQVISPTPNAASLFKYAEYPVNYSTGLPEITIPLFEVKSGQLSVPITLSYHSSGRKVYDETGAVGIGWTLMAGGMISRTVYGDPDNEQVQGKEVLFPYPWKMKADINSKNDIVFLGGVDNDNSNSIQWYDTEYDIYSYSVNSISGKFILKDNNNIKTPVLIPKKPYKITYSQGSFTLTDDKGITYEFNGGTESTFSKTGKPYYATNGWLLSKITSPDKSDVITFKYLAFSKNRRRISQQTTIVDNWINPPNGYCADIYPRCPTSYVSDDGPQGTYNDEGYLIERLTEIDFNQGKVIFNLQPNSDVAQNMQILNSSGTVLKTVVFNISSLDLLSDGNSPTSKLTSVTFKDNTSNPIETYQFEYYPTIYPGSYTSVNARFCDFWGYYNASGQENMRPRIDDVILYACGGTETVGIGNPGASRDPNLTAAESGVLKKITYPTGGMTEYTYELNKYYNDASQQVKTCGGLRLSQIKSDDGTGNSIYKIYKYGVGESGYGFLPLVPSVDNMSYTNQYINYFDCGGFGYTDIDVSYRQRTFSADINPIFSYIAQKPVIYTEVAEYQGTTGNNVGKTIYKYDYDDNIAPKSIAVLFQPVDYKYWKNSSLIEKTDYKNDGAGNYMPVKTIKNTYTETEYSVEAIYGLHVQRAIVTAPATVRDLDNAGLGSGLFISSYIFAANHNVMVFNYGDYTLSVGKKELTGTQEINYTDDSKPITILTGYTYNSNHLLSATTTTVSNNDVVSQNFKYPFDFSTDATCQTMVTDNMLNYVIQEDDYKNSLLIKTTKTDYYNWGSSTNHLIYPQTVEMSKGSNPLQRRLRYYAYDNTGNPLSVSKEKDVHISYLWGYNNSYPIAEVKNANSNEILFTSFEEGSGWDASLTAYDNTTSHAGKYSGRIDKSTTGELVSLGTKWLSVSLLTTSKFHYSGWVYSNGPGVQIYLFMKRAGETGYYSYIDNISTTTTNKWVYLEKDYTVPSDVAQLNIRLDNNGGGTVWFDDIRLHPSSAMMKTYTYEPLVGMTSMTDVNNQTTYFEYDPYSRLKLIRDMNKNILKTYGYKYQVSTP
jgi:hypothetical protein